MSARETVGEGAARRPAGEADGTAGVGGAESPRGAPGPASRDTTPTGAALSFLCTAYRTEAYLPDTIASVLAQTRPDWELVVVDNGMSDEIRDIVLAHDDPRVVLVRQENAGMEGGVQAAAAAASGRYVAVLNSDDQVTPRYVERMAGVLDAHPEVDVVGCDAFVVEGRTGNVRRQSFRRSHSGPRRPSFSHSLTVAELIDGAPMYYTAAVRREAWDRVGGFKEVPGLADTSLWLRLLRGGADIRMIPDLLCRYLYRGDSLSRDPASAAEFQASQEKAYLDGAEGSGDPAVHEALARKLRLLRYHQSLRHARTALLAGDVALARTEADRAISHRIRPRSLAVAAAVRVAPHGVMRLWPLKQQVAQGASDVVALLSPTRRRAGAGS